MDIELVLKFVNIHFPDDPYFYIESIGPKNWQLTDKGGHKMFSERDLKLMAFDWLDGKLHNGDEMNLSDYQLIKKGVEPERKHLLEIIIKAAVELDG